MLDAQAKGADLAVVAKMREGYEAAVIRRMKESGFLEVEIRVECLGRCGDSYDDPVISAGWHYWQESRETAVVEFPDRRQYVEHHPDVEGGCFNYGQYLADVAENIRGQGLKMEPVAERKA